MKIVGLVGTNVEYACVMGSVGLQPVRTVIHTKNRGSVTIGQLEIGDEVFTQTGEYHPVSAISRFPVIEKPNLVTIEVDWRQGKNHLLTVTDDHKILCHRDGINAWFFAKDLNENDEIYSRKKISHNKDTAKFSTLICAECGCIFERLSYMVNSNEQLCSPECFRLWRIRYHTGRKRSSETRKLLSELAQQRLLENPDIHPSRIVAKRGHKTSHEKYVESFLKQNHFRYFRQYPVGKHIVDFMIPSKRTIIEADGAYWHQNQLRDIKRDRELSKELPGWKIVHLHFKDRRFSPKDMDPYPISNVTYLQCNSSMNSFAFEDQFERKKIQRITKWRYNNKGFAGGNRPPFLYDITVQNIHSFVVNGILVSNSHLEMGTSKMQPRPWLFPALKRKQGEIAILFRQTLKKL